MNNTVKKITWLAALGLLWAVTVHAEVPGQDNGDKPVVETSAAEQNAMSQSQEGLVVERAQGGGEMVDLQGRFQMYAKVIMVDGKPHYTCQSHPGLHAEMHVHTVPAKPAARAVK